APSSACRARPRCSSSTSPTPTIWPTLVITSPSSGAGSTACSTRSRSRPRPAWAGGSSSRAGTTWPRRFTCRPTRSRRWPTWPRHSCTTAARSSASTSTRGRRGRSTTGWASPRPRSSRLPATSPGTSGRRGSGSTWCAPARCARLRPAASPASPRSRTSGRRAPRSVGTSTAATRWRVRASPCCRTGSRPRRVRWSTSTAASTPWAREISPRNQRLLGEALAGAGEVAGHLGERGLYDGGLVVVEETAEVPLYAAQVGDRRPAQARPPLVGDDHPRHPPVGRAGGSLHEPGVLHAVDQAGEPTRREEHRAGQLVHGEVALRGALEPEEHLVPRHRDAVFGLQLVVEPAQERGVGGQEGPPRIHTRLVEAARHAFRVPGIPLLLQRLREQLLFSKGAGIWPSPQRSGSTRVSTSPRPAPTPSTPRTRASSSSRDP